jgi:hypothetical protein
MERKPAATRAALDHGLGALPWQILWQEMRILGYDIWFIIIWEHTADFLQVGDASWNGAIQFRWKSLARELSRVLARLKQPLRSRCITRHGNWTHNTKSMRRLRLDEMLPTGQGGGVG